MKETKDRQEIYTQLKKIASKYEEEMIVKSDFGSRYELSAKGEYEVRSERTGLISIKKEPFFVGVIIQSDYVGLYLTSPYVEPDQFDVKEISNAMRLLKGKSCFHVKSLDEPLRKEIELLIDKSYELFKSKDWLGA